MKILFVSAALLSSILAHATESKCARELTQSSRTTTESFIAYLAELHVMGAIADVGLEALVNSDSGVVNPISHELGATNASAAIHRAGIADIIATGDLDHSAIQKWAKDKLSERGSIQIKRNEIRDATSPLHQQMLFHSIPLGTFEVEFMSTQVTQKMWVDVMGYNPAQFHKGFEYSTVLDLGNSKVELNADHPVEWVSWWSAVYFANEVSKRHGREPVYDFTGIEFVDLGVRREERTVLAADQVFTIAARGALGTLDEQVSPKINSQKQDVYQTFGYRLPTEIEQRRLLDIADNAELRRSPQFGYHDLVQYAWFDEISRKSTHPVAEKKSMIVDGKRFFDLLGNVEEWSGDWFEEKFTGGQNLQSALSGYYRVIRRGSYASNGDVVRDVPRAGYEPSFRFHTLGFRLVRTLK